MAHTSFKDLTFKKKIEHIWFYYKWYIVAALFLGFAAFICINQIVSRPNYDITVLWAQQGKITSKSIDRAREELEKYCPDFNGDGEVHVDLRFIGLDYNTINVSSQSLTEQTSSEEISDTSSEYVDRQLELTYKMQLLAEMTSGDSFVYILDDEVYDMLVELNGFRDISKEINHDCSYIEKDRLKLQSTPLEYINTKGDENKYLLVCGENAIKAKDNKRYDNAFEFVKAMIDKSHELKSCIEE